MATHWGSGYYIPVFTICRLKFTKLPVHVWDWLQFAMPFSSDILFLSGDICDQFTKLSDTAPNLDVFGLTNFVEEGPPNFWPNFTYPNFTYLWHFGTLQSLVVNGDWPSDLRDPVLFLLDALVHMLTPFCLVCRQFLGFLPASLCDTWSWSDDNDTLSGIAILDTTAVVSSRRYQR